jgi:polyisoprenoid-binding protein YceI
MFKHLMFKHIFATSNLITMKKMIFTVMSMIALSGAAQVSWKMDKSHSKVGFAIEHMMISQTEGYFKIYDGKVDSKSETDFTDAKVEFTIDAASINTDDEQRDNHLKSPDFFDVANHPKITFVSTSMKPAGKNTWKLEGNLTMKGVTKKVTLTAVGSGKTMKDPWGNTKYGFKVSGKLNRKDFGITWNKVLDAGGTILGDEVEINCKIELNKA